MTLSAEIKAARARLLTAHREYMHAIRRRRAVDKEAADARFSYAAAFASGDREAVRGEPVVPDFALTRATLDTYTDATARVAEAQSMVDTCRARVVAARGDITRAELASARTEGTQ